MNPLSTRIHDVLAAHLDRGGMVLGDGVRSGGNGGCTAGLAKLHDRAVIDVPIGDHSALGLGLGLALGGRPVCVELASASSLVPSILADAVRSSFAPSLVVRVPSGGEAGPLDSLPALAGVPIWSGTEATLPGVLDRCLQRGVHLVLEPRTAYGLRCASVESDAVVEHRTGVHVTIATWGKGVAAALAAACELSTEGVEATVIELLQVSPVPKALTESVVRTGRLVVCHPDSPSLAASIQQAVLPGAFLYLESPFSDCLTRPASVIAAVRDSVHY